MVHATEQPHDPIELAGGGRCVCVLGERRDGGVQQAGIASGAGQCRLLDRRVGREADERDQPAIQLGAGIAQRGDVRRARACGERSPGIQNVVQRRPRLRSFGDGGVFFSVDSYFAVLAL